MNILDPATDIHKSTTLQASAGTGKTFLIENLIVRLLLEKDPMPIERILAVTFTRAATRDLKARIRSNIASIILLIEGKLRGEEVVLPPYIEIYSGQQALRLARRTLEHALLCFDRAEVFTIHGFCHKMLAEHLFEGDFCPTKGSSESALPKSHLLRVIRDYFRTEIKEPMFNAVELQSVIKLEGSVAALEKKLLHLVSQGIKIEGVPSFLEMNAAFVAQVDAMGWQSADEIFDQIFVECQKCKGVFNRKRELKPEIEKLFQNSATYLFLKDYESFISAGQELNKLFADHKSFLFKFFPLVDPYIPLTRMASGIFERFSREIEENELLSADDLLHAMRSALKSSEFIKGIQKRYSAVIIDEFQDTDPVQWEIFQTLFQKSSSHLMYLVGDPKQSIYGFRQADIYTYRRARESIERKETLTTNWRSTKELVDAQNALFSHSKQLFCLPREGDALPFEPAEASSKVRPQDGASAALTFWIAEEKGISLPRAEEELFLPKIVEEILRGGKPYSQNAILVADRFQAERVADYLRKASLSSVRQKRESLVETKAYMSLKIVLEGIVHPSNPSKVKLALMEKIFGWTEEALEALQIPETFAAAVFEFKRLRMILLEKGMSSLFYELFDSPLGRGLKALLSEEEGEHFYHDLLQIAEILFEQKNTPEGYLFFLNELSLLDLSDDPRLKRLPFGDEDAVRILTIHASKGLEFDRVFLLGLIKRNSEPERIIQVARKEGVRLCYVQEEDVEYQKFKDELDAEKMRQLYVAFTRAKYEVFCPIWTHKHTVVPATGSCMELFLEKCSLEEIATASPNIRLEKVYPAVIREQKEIKIDETALIAPEKFTLEFHRKEITSFSRLTKGKSFTVEKIAAVESTLLNPHTMPKGAEIGLVFHEIFENIPFNMSKLCDIEAYVLPYLKRGGFAEWKSVVAHMVESALHTDFGGFSFKDIKPQNALRETPFLFDRQEDMIKGVMDLIFEHDGKFYLVDYKTNWLGDNESFYNPANLERAMEQNGYNLQAALYLEGALRWISLFDKRAPKELFGGIFYLFLRGGENGVWKKFSISEINCCVKNIR